MERVPAFRSPNLDPISHTRSDPEFPSPQPHSLSRPQRDEDGEILKTWQQKFTVSRIIQTMRRACLRRKIISDPEYRHLLSRQHVKLTQTGQVKGKRKLSGVEKAVKKMGEKSFASRIEDSVECYDCSEYDPPATGAAERAEGSGSGS